MARTSERLTYAAAQAARVAFYGAHYLAARVIARDAFKSIEKLDHPIPSLGAVLKSMRGIGRMSKRGSTPHRSTGSATCAARWRASGS
jgi:hypothetical protein